MKLLDTLLEYGQSMFYFVLTWWSFDLIYTEEANIFEIIILAFLGMFNFITGIECIININIKNYDEKRKKNESKKENKDE